MTKAVSVIAVVGTAEAAEAARAVGSDHVASADRDGAMLTDVADPARRWMVLRAEAFGADGAGPTATAGVAGIVIRTEGGRTLAARLPALATALAAARRIGLRAGFGGAFEPPDLPRLLALRPDLLAVDGGRPDILDAAVAASRDAASAPADPAQTSRVFVRDYVAEFGIGAYAHERGVFQRVRFDVVVEVAAPPAPAAMADVFSYDVITDFLAGLPTREHVDLVETVAEELAAHVLADPRVCAVTVAVEKLDLGPYRAGVEITRRR